MKNNYTQLGRVVKILPEKVVSSTFRTRELVLETVEVDAKYSQLIVFQFMNDYADILHTLKPGDLVTVTFSLQGREWQGRYYNTLRGWTVKNEYGEKVKIDDSYEWANFGTASNDEVYPKLSKKTEHT
jgi:single-strand DNA-binding protein